MYLYIVNYLFVLIGSISRPSSAPTTAHSDMENEVGNNFFQIFFWKYFFQIVFSPERFPLFVFPLFGICVIRSDWSLGPGASHLFDQPTGKLCSCPELFQTKKIHEENYVLPRSTLPVFLLPLSLFPLWLKSSTDLPCLKIICSSFTNGADFQKCFPPKKTMAVVIWSLFYQLIISPIHGARDIEVSPLTKQEKQALISKYFLSWFRQQCPVSGGRPERAPNDDREREFVNSKSNYLGEITFRGDWERAADVSTFSGTHFFSELDTLALDAEKRGVFYLPTERSLWEAFENIARIKVNVRNQMVVKSSQNWKI